MKRVTGKLGAYLVLAILTMGIMSNLNSVQALSQLEVTATTTKPYYWLRENVTIYGNVTFDDEPVQEGLVAIEIEDPNRTLSMRTVPAGTIPSQEWGVEILSVSPCDASGNPKTSFVRGDFIWFKVTVRNNHITQEEVLITINIYDNDAIPLTFSYAKTTMIPQSTSISMSRLWIYEWASTGTAVAYVNVLTDWPKDGGYPYSPEKQANFEITEVDEEIYGQTLLETPVQASNGAYEASLRLSPQPPPGPYLVYVTAYSQGYHAFTGTTFIVNSTYPGSPPPRASFVYTPPKPGPGMEIRFDASSSTAEGYGDSIANYTWDFGDLQNDAGKIVRHTYLEEGNYTVTLNVTDSEGFWNTTSRIIRVKITRDIAVTGIQCLDMIYSDWTVTIKTVVKNKGNTAETFNVTAYYDSFVIDVLTITQLPAFETSTLTFTWNTAGIIIPANYTIKAEADTIPDEINVTNNVFLYEPVLARMLGDVRYDRLIDIFDVVKVTGIYGTVNGEPEWDIQADLKLDGIIDIFDVVKVTGIYGTTY